MTKHVEEISAWSSFSNDFRWMLKIIVNIVVVVYGVVVVHVAIVVQIAIVIQIVVFVGAYFNA